jgi:hypothetical protein
MALIGKERVALIPRILELAIFSAVTIVALSLRRPDQFRHPYFWVEDGAILGAYSERGFASILEPLNGYHVLATRTLDAVAFKLSILHAPEIAVLLVTAFTAAVVVAVAFSPTHLPWPRSCAIALLIVPTDPEVFAVAEYAFWWAGILLFLALLWDNERGGRGANGCGSAIS